MADKEVIELNAAGALDGTELLHIVQGGNSIMAVARMIAGLATGEDFRVPVRAASTANVTLATDVENGDALDGVTLATDDRILLKNQTTASENGPYTVNASGAPTRAVDADANGEIVEDMIFQVTEGTTNAGTFWQVTSTDPIVVDTDDITFASYTPADLTKPIEPYVVAAGDETTAITTGTKVTFRMPYAFTLTEVRASLTTAGTTGTTVDIHEGGTSILSTKLTFDANEKTTTTAATPAVISDAALADDAEMTIDVDAAGTGAKGLKVTLIGRRT